MNTPSADKQGRRHFLKRLGTAMTRKLKSDQSLSVTQPLEKLNVTTDDLSDGFHTSRVLNQTAPCFTEDSPKISRKKTFLGFMKKKRRQKSYLDLGNDSIDAGTRSSTLSSNKSEVLQCRRRESLRVTQPLEKLNVTTGDFSDGFRTSRVLNQTAPCFTSPKISRKKTFLGFMKKKRRQKIDFDFGNDSVDAETRSSTLSSFKSDSLPSRRYSHSSIHFDSIVVEVSSTLDLEIDSGISTACVPSPAAQDTYTPSFELSLPLLTMEETYPKIKMDFTKDLERIGEEDCEYDLEVPEEEKNFYYKSVLW